MDNQYRTDILFPSSSKQTEKAEDEVAIVAQQVSSILDRLPSQKLEADYVPQVVSLGALHFGKPQLGKYEIFKDELPDIHVDRAGRPSFKNLVADMIGQGCKIRQWYELLHIHIVVTVTSNWVGSWLETAYSFCDS